MAQVPFDEERRLADLHFRAGRLEGIIRRFGINTDGGSIYGGFGELKGPVEDIHQRISIIESSVSGFGLDAGDGLSAIGTFNEGYIIKGERVAAQIISPVVTGGACCLGSVCVLFPDAGSCTLNSGIWLGNGTTCDGTPCDEGGGGPPAGGVCCELDGSCTETTEGACASDHPDAIWYGTHHCLSAPETCTDCCNRIVDFWNITSVQPTFSVSGSATPTPSAGCTSHGLSGSHVTGSFNPVANICAGSAASTGNVDWSFTTSPSGFSSPECTVRMVLQLTCASGIFSIHFTVVESASTGGCFNLCSPLFNSSILWGGGLSTVSLGSVGTNPIGTHTIDLVDSTLSGITWRVVVVIS